MIIETKVCSICYETKELSEYYVQIKKKSNGDEYTYCPPYCKKCTSEKFKKWAKDNVNKKRKNNQKYEKTTKGIQNRQKRIKSYNERGKRKQWIENNKDKLYEYNQRHRKHEITKNEWESCKIYFNHSCAYCGINESEAKEKYDNYLHKEHVEHNGENDLSNCIPACKSCNCSKWTYSLEEWYTDKNNNFSEERLLKIIQWLENDYKNFKE